MSRKSATATRSTFVLMAATSVSRLLGFVRNAVVGALFGQTWKADVLNAVFNIPFNLRKLMAEGALSTAFIPVLAQSIEDDPTLQKSKDLSRSILTFQLIILIPLVLLAIIFAAPIISVLAPFSIPEKQLLAVHLFRWFILYLILVSIAAVLMAVLNTHHHFGSPAVSPILFSISVIGFLIWLYPTMNVDAQIPGVLIGGLAQVIFQGFFFKKLGYSFKPKRHFWTPELKKTIRNWLPALSISVIALISQQISISLAALLPEGSVSSLMNAIVFWQLPNGVLSASIVTVYFPRMSRQAAQKDWSGVSKSMTQGLELQALLLIPAGFLMSLFSGPLISIAFQRQNFTFADTLVTSAVLSVLSWGLFTSGLFNYTQRFFFSQGNFRTPFRINLLWAALDLIISIVLMNTPLHVLGLAWGTTISFFVSSLVMLLLAWKSLDKSRLHEYLFFTLKVILSLLPSWGVWLLLLHFTGIWWAHGLTLSSFGLFVGEGILLLGLIVLMLMLLGIRPWRLLRRSSKE